METEIRFKVEVAIGITGAALLSIRERYTGTGTESAELRKVIESLGVEYWISDLGFNKPPSPGVYWVSGSASFSEYSAEYSNTSLWETDRYTRIGEDVVKSLRGV